MFGGIGFLFRGNMCVGVWKEFLILRLGADQYEGALREPCVREFDITGRAMKGWVMVRPDGVEGDEELRTWVRRAAAFVGTLPPKG
jgi:TfoX/Sxy family transcriptional regulator of competence genes